MLFWVPIFFVELVVASLALLVVSPLVVGCELGVVFDVALLCSY